MGATTLEIGCRPPLFYKMSRSSETINLSIHFTNFSPVGAYMIVAYVFPATIKQLKFLFYREVLTYLLEIINNW